MGYETPQSSNNQFDLDIILCGQIDTQLQNDVQIIGDIAFSLHLMGGFFAYNISDPAEPVELDSFLIPSPYNTDVNGGHSFQVVNDLAYIAFYLTGLYILNISDPTQFEELDHYYTSGQTFHWSAIDGDLIYCTRPFEGILILNVSNPSSIQRVGFYSAEVNYYYIYGAHQVAFAYDNSRRVIQLLNTSNPANLVKISSLALNPTQILVKGNFAFITLQTGGMKIYNLTHIEEPELIHYYNPGSRIRDLDFYGCLVFLSAVDSLHILNVSDPSAPVEIGQIGDGGQASTLSVSDKFVCIGYEFKFMEIYGWNRTGREYCFIYNPPTSTNSINGDPQISGYPTGIFGVLFIFTFWGIKKKSKTCSHAFQ